MYGNGKYSLSTMISSVFVSGSDILKVFGISGEETVRGKYRNRNSRLTVISCVFASGSYILNVLVKLISREAIVRACTEIKTLRLTVIS